MKQTALLMLLSFLLGYVLSCQRETKPQASSPELRDQIVRLQTERAGSDSIRVVERKAYDLLKETIGAVPDTCVHIYTALVACDSLLQRTEIVLIQGRSIESIQIAAIVQADTMYFKEAKRVEEVKRRRNGWRVAALVGWAVAVGMVIGR